MTLAGELLVRFALGGAIVSAFAFVGDAVKPKTFSGIFGAAPSVALATLGLTFAKDGSDVVAVMGRSMMIGSVALYVYGAACVAATKREKWPVWLSAIGAWIAWFAVTLSIWGVGTALGALE